MSEMITEHHKFVAGRNGEDVQLRLLYRDHGSPQTGPTSKDFD